MKHDVDMQEDVEDLKVNFENARPAVPRHLVASLFRYWCARKPAGLLFPEDLQNLALYLHAQAYGEDITLLKKNEPLMALLSRHWAACGPLMPEPLVWGPMAILSDSAPVGLDSSVLQAFVFLDDDVPQRVIVVGEGLQSIYAAVFQSMCIASLQIRPGHWDFVNLGVMNVQLREAQVPLQLPFQVLGDAPVALSPNEAKTAEAVMSNLVSALKRLERDTAMIRVHEVDNEIDRELKKKWDQLAEDMADGGVKLWAPGTSSQAKKSTPLAEESFPYGA